MDELINIQTASKILGVHKETLRRWDRKGILKAVKVGLRGDRRYVLKDIEAIINQNKK